MQNNELGVHLVWTDRPAHEYWLSALPLEQVSFALNSVGMQTGCHTHTHIHTVSRTASSILPKNFGLLCLTSYPSTLTLHPKPWIKPWIRLRNNRYLCRIMAGSVGPFKHWLDIVPGQQVEFPGLRDWRVAPSVTFTLSPRPGILHTGFQPSHWKLSCVYNSVIISTRLMLLQISSPMCSFKEKMVSNNP